MIFQLKQMLVCFLLVKRLLSFPMVCQTTVSTRNPAAALVSLRSTSPSQPEQGAISALDDDDDVRMSVEKASQLLANWDRLYNDPDNDPKSPSPEQAEMAPFLPEAVRFLNEKAIEERMKDSTQGRCMLGICAGSPEEGVATLKSWVTELQLPRGLLHGMDKDGVALDLSGGVYIKYNTGGVYTFADIRKSGMGFDALWKPGDALLEPYDGDYRGTYFQVELQDGEFRQYLVPLDIFGKEDS